MKTIKPIILLLAGGLALFASPREAPQLDDPRGEPTIEKLFPADYANFRNRLRGDHGPEDAKASLQLLSKVKDRFGSPSSGEAQLRALRNAYQAAWRICLREFQQTNDKGAQGLVLGKWDESLKLDDDAVPSQVYALLADWDRRLLTDRLWRLAMETKTRRTVASLSYAFYMHGDRQDAERLEGRLKRETDTATGELIANAISYMNWRLGGSKGPGPAAMPPRPVE